MSVGADHGLRLLLHLRERELLRQGGGGDAALHGAGASAPWKEALAAGFVFRGRGVFGVARASFLGGKCRGGGAGDFGRAAET